MSSPGVQRNQDGPFQAKRAPMSVPIWLDPAAFRQAGAARRQLARIALQEATSAVARRSGPPRPSGCPSAPAQKVTRPWLAPWRPGSSRQLRSRSLGASSRLSPLGKRLRRRQAVAPGGGRTWRCVQQDEGLWPPLSSLPALLRLLHCSGCAPGRPRLGWSLREIAAKAARSRLHPAFLSAWRASKFSCRTCTGPPWSLAARPRRAIALRLSRRGGPEQRARASLGAGEQCCAR